MQDSKREASPAVRWSDKLGAWISKLVQQAIEDLKGMSRTSGVVPNGMCPASTNAPIVPLRQILAKSAIEVDTARNAIPITDRLNFQQRLSAQIHSRTLPNRVQ